MAWGSRIVTRKKKKEFQWSQMYDQDQDKNDLIRTLKRFWIPLLEQTLEQARQLLEKLEKER